MTDDDLKLARNGWSTMRIPVPLERAVGTFEGLASSLRALAENPGTCLIVKTRVRRKLGLIKVYAATDGDLAAVDEIVTQVLRRAIWH